MTTPEQLEKEAAELDLDGRGEDAAKRVLDQAIAGWKQANGRIAELEALADDLAEGLTWATSGAFQTAEQSERWGKVGRPYLAAYEALMPKPRTT